jgi:hypothetical protein
MNIGNGLQDYDQSVFINCPFDEKYKSLFRAILFAVYDCGFVARCALEEDDGSQIRVQKIYHIISRCRLGIHDRSRVQIDRTSRLPRFNMPLELGAFLGAKYFGVDEQKNKACLILDSVEHRYQKFISDIAGQDIRAHGNDIGRAIGIVRDWLRTYSGTSIPSGSVISNRYTSFRKKLPAMCSDLSLNTKELIYNDFVLLVSRWLRLNYDAG